MGEYLLRLLPISLWASPPAQESRSCASTPPHAEILRWESLYSRLAVLNTIACTQRTLSEGNDIKQLQDNDHTNTRVHSRMRSSALIVVVVALCALFSAVQAYHLGGDEMMCWERIADDPSTNVLLAACPASFRHCMCDREVSSCLVRLCPWWWCVFAFPVSVLPVCCVGVFKLDPLVSWFLSLLIFFLSSSSSPSSSSSSCFQSGLIPRRPP
jgi:hypothetical protein